MAISPLSVQQIVAVIRQQITEPVGILPSPSPLVAGRPGRKGAGSDSRQMNQSGLGKLITLRVGALQAQDPERGRKAFRIFLESVLVNELGENLINDPGFSEMVEDIQAQMEKDSHIAAAMREAIGQLLSGVDPAIGASR